MIKKTQGFAAKSLAKASAVGGALMVAAGSVLAAAPAAPNVTEGETFLLGLLVPIATLGAAYLIVTIAIRGWKIMRGI